MHTPEPWWVTPSGIVLAHDSNAEPIATCDPSGATAAELKANARRIVACVNACEGLTTEALENYYRNLTTPATQPDTVTS